MGKTIELEPDGESIGTTLQKFGVAQETALALRAHFEPFEQKAKEWAEKARELIVTDISQVKKMRQAREARLVLKGVRGEITAKHKELKEDALRKGQVLDTIKRKLSGMIEPIEAILERSERYIEVLEEEERKRLHEERVELLTPYMGADADSLPLGEMNAIAFESLYQGMKEAKVRKEREEKEAEERKRKEEEERIKNEAKQREINSRTRRLSAIGLQWNDKLHTFTMNDLSVAMDTVEEYNEIDFDDIIKDLKTEIGKRKAKSDEEQRKKDDQARKDREARLKLEKAAADKRLAEEQAEKDRKASERKAKRAPDKVKLLALAERISLLECQPMKDDDAQNILDNAVNMLSKVCHYIKINADRL